MISLSADNRSLLTTGPYSYLLDNLAAGTNSLATTNVSGFAVDDLIVIGLFGNDNAEIFRISAIDTSTNTLTIVDPSGSVSQTAFAHSESTKITKIQCDQVRFYWTALLGTIADEDPTFDTDTPLTDWMDIVPSEWFTTYDDAAHSTGFGWFLFRNSVTLEASQNSNAIPYAGFATNTVKLVFDDFMSLLNNRELTLVTNDDMYAWLNEGLAMVRNKLNLANPEYTVSTLKTLTVTSGTSEYLLDADFGDLVQIVDTGSYPLPGLSVRDAMSYIGDQARYYVRGRYIGLVPVPSQATTYSYRYRSRGTRLTSYDDLIDLPDHGFYILKDWMMYRACLKFQNPNASTFYKSFADGLNTMIVSSVKRDARLDSWSIAPWANA